MDEPLQDGTWSVMMAFSFFASFSPFFTLRRRKDEIARFRIGYTYTPTPGVVSLHLKHLYWPWL